jgi:mannose/cellobiose epimerase-like protein (N-acyl-D-glucosamine 2-epimerase family)
MTEAKERTARTQHICELCERVIRPGWRYINRTGIDPEYGRWSSHAHPACWEIAKAWTREQWEAMDGPIPGGEWPDLDEQGMAVDSTQQAKGG